MLDLDFRGVRRESVGEGGDEQRAFVCFQDGVDHVALVCAQHTALVFHSDVRHFVAREVYDFGAVAAQCRVFALLAVSADTVAAFVDFREKCVDFFGRILQVGVERNDDVARRAFECGDDCRVLPVVAVEVDELYDVGAFGAKAAQHFARGVPTAVIDENHLPASAERVHCFAKSVEEVSEISLFVVHGDYDRNVHI